MTEVIGPRKMLDRTDHLLTVPTDDVTAQPSAGNPPGSDLTTTTTTIYKYIKTNS